MANQEQLEILKRGVDVWNKWRDDSLATEIDLHETELSDADLRGADLGLADLGGANLRGARFGGAILIGASFRGASLIEADLRGANLRAADLGFATLHSANLSKAKLGSTGLDNIDLSETIGLEEVVCSEASSLGIDTLQLSKGKIPEAFLRGCGLSDWEIKSAKLYNPDLSNDEINKALYKMYDLRAQQPLQISPLFISYSHTDSDFVDKLEKYLNKKGIRFWRDAHDAIAGKLEKQIDRAIRQNPTVLLVLSESSIKSDWVQHEVRKAREMEKDIGRDVLCPVALDESWKESPWPERIMEQVMEYNILDFSTWEDNTKFKNMFRKLTDGLNLYYRK